MKKRLIRDTLGNWNRFWFMSEPSEQLKVFRFLFCLVLFFSYLIRTPDLDFFYSDRGILQLSLLPDVYDPAYRFSLFHYFTSRPFLWIANFVFLLSLFMMALGRFRVLCSATALILHISFIHRNMAPMFGVDALASFFLFYLFLSDLSQAGVRDIFNLFKLKITDSGQFPSIESVALRLMQIQVCVIYAYSGFHKLKGAAWWNGDAIWYVLGNLQMARWDLGWIAKFPLVVGIATYCTLLWEVYFASLVWNQKAKPWILLLGVFMHIMIGTVLKIPLFALAMISTYALFLTPVQLSQMKKIALNFCSFFKRTSSNS